MSFMKFAEKCNFDNMYSNPECHVVSKTFSISNNTAALVILLLKFSVTLSVSLMYWSVVLWCAQKPNWLAFSKLFSSTSVWTIFYMTSSESLPIVDRMLIGLKFCGNFGSLLGFGKVITFASFHDDNRKQWLNKCVRWTSGVLGRCLRHSFGMISIPQAFLKFRECIKFCTSQGLTLSWGLLTSVWTLVSTPVHGVRHTGHVVWTDFPNSQ
jgi:hypothetical protein